jgi:hypothetical protein
MSALEHLPAAEARQLLALAGLALRANLKPPVLIALPWQPEFSGPDGLRAAARVLVAQKRVARGEPAWPSLAGLVIGADDPDS